MTVADLWYEALLAQWKELGKNHEYYRLYSIILEKCPEEFKEIFTIYGPQEGKVIVSKDTTEEPK